MIFSAIFTDSERGSGEASSASRSGPSAMVLSGWLSFEPSRYSALAFSISCHDSRYACLTSSTLASCGILIVFDRAPQKKGGAGATRGGWGPAEGEGVAVLPPFGGAGKGGWGPGLGGG